LYKLFVALAGVLIAGSAAAQTVQPYNPPTGYTLVSNRGALAQYGATSAVPNWRITQWGASGQMQNFAMKSSGNFESDNNFASAKVAPNGAVTLVQDGAAISCTDAGGQPQEFDSLIEPVPAALNRAVYPTKAAFPSLAQLQSINVSGTVTVNEGRASPGSVPCELNQANVHYGIMLIDKAVSPTQMMWWGVPLAHFCEPDPAAPDDPHYRHCMNRSPVAQWYWTGLTGRKHLTKDKDGNIKIVNFAVSDVPGTFGLSEISGNAPMALNVDFLPRLSALIGSGKFGIDPNLADWKVTEFSYGQSLWGDTYLSTTWQGFVPSWTVK